MPNPQDLFTGMAAARWNAMLNGLSRYGTGPQQMTAVDMARGAVAGQPATPDLYFAGASPEEMALYDRLAWGQQMQHQYGKIPAVLSGAVMGGAYEGTKALREAVPGVTPVLSRIGEALGAPPGQDWMSKGATGSKPSLQNVLALIYGAARSPEAGRTQKRSLKELMGW